MKRNALISVYDKSSLKKICQVFNKFNIGIISTGATAKKIISLGYKCTEISNLTKFKEILDGRVKTLDPKIHASILYKRNNPEHEKVFKKLNFPIIDFVIVNFYPFTKILFSIIISLLDLNIQMLFFLVFIIIFFLFSVIVVEISGIR